jgi:hypothetical protein
MRAHDHPEMTMGSLVILDRLEIAPRKWGEGLWVCSDRRFPVHPEMRLGRWYEVERLEVIDGLQTATFTTESVQLRLPTKNLVVRRARPDYAFRYTTRVPESATEYRVVAVPICPEGHPGPEYELQNCPDHLDCTACGRSYPVKTEDEDVIR